MLCFGAVFGGRHRFGLHRCCRFLPDFRGRLRSVLMPCFASAPCLAGSAVVIGLAFANVAGSFPSSCLRFNLPVLMLCFASAPSSAVWRSSSARPSRVDAMLRLVVRRPSSFRPSQVDAMLRFGAVFGSRHLFSVPELMLCGTERISIPFTKRKEYHNETNIGSE